jgi:hypothetical protein
LRARESARFSRRQSSQMARASAMSSAVFMPLPRAVVR